MPCHLITHQKKIVKYNNLIDEKSPYLLQHADNPVDWYPWTPKAFEKASKEDKPIFLSIGYSTCHWCHVMAHECFEDPEVATLMNEVFISIKVDREERPDIDSVYMMVCQMMTGSGGWPLTIIMTPDKKPFFAATYIPKESRFGRIGMLELIPRIREVWTTRRNEVLGSADQITSTLKENLQNEPGQELDESILKSTYKRLAASFDKNNGGFSIAPKFPTPHNLQFLLRYWKRTSDKEALEMVEKTLRNMRMGGMYDHLGYGFHRYSTDSYWLVPHFEKMLYDQALLAMAYTDAFQATGLEEFNQTAREIFTYVLRDMTAPGGGFYSAEDADSEGEEGKFYLWTVDEIQQVLSKTEADFLISVFNVKEEGNFAEEATGTITGKNILHLKKSINELAAEMDMSKQEFKNRIDDLRQKLFDHRKKRIHPHKDDKVLTDWNGLMIAALAKGARPLNEPKFTKAAKNSVDFILKNLRNTRGRLLHRFRDGQASILSQVDDYTFLIWGLLELYETTFEVRYLQTALKLNQDLIKHFWDEKSGGFYSTADDAEELLVRQKEIQDGAIPSGNSVAMLNLLRLARITANSDLEDKAAKIERAFSENIKQAPVAYTQLMVAMDFAFGPSYEVVIVGKPHRQDTKNMLQALRSHFIPNKVVILNPSNQDSSEIERIAEFTKYQKSVRGRATAYVCFNHRCKSPTNDINEMLKFLNVE